MKTIPINGDYITLGQLLKSVDLVSSGGEAKAFLTSYEIMVNQEPEERRGRKLYPQDVVEIEGYGKIQMV
jgi:ribosome-associated protein